MTLTSGQASRICFKIRFNSSTQSGLLMQAANEFWIVSEFPEGSGRDEVPSHKNGNQEEEDEQDDSNEPEGWLGTVAATPRCAGLSGLVLHGVPQLRALSRRRSPENIFGSEHGTVSPE